MKALAEMGCSPEDLDDWVEYWRASDEDRSRVEAEFKRHGTTEHYHDRNASKGDTSSISAVSSNEHEDTENKKGVRSVRSVGGVI